MPAQWAVLLTAFSSLAETVDVLFHTGQNAWCRTENYHLVRFPPNSVFIGFRFAQTNSWYELNAPAGSASVEIVAAGNDAICFDQILFDGVPVVADLPFAIDDPCQPSSYQGMQCATGHLWAAAATTTTTSTSRTLTSTTSTATWTGTWPTLTSTTSTATWTGTSTTLTGTTSTTTLTCPSGFFLDGMGPCLPCPEGTSAHAGAASPCLPLLTTFLDTVAPTLNVESDGYGIVRMQLTAPPLPDQGMLYDGIEMAYSIDIGPTHDVLLPNSKCGALWLETEQGPAVSLMYGQLSTPCSLSVQEDGQSIHRLGFVALFITAAGENQVQVLRSFIVPVDLSFPAEVVASSQQFATWANVTFGLHTFELSPFDTALELFQSSTFGQPVTVPVFQENADVFAQHTLLGPSSLMLSVQSAWLSSSSNATDKSALLFNLTDALKLLQSPPGSARFQFTSIPCDVCVLHVFSRVTTVGLRRSLRSAPASSSSATNSLGRRLRSAQTFSLASVAFQVRAHADPPPPTSLVTVVTAAAAGLVMLVAAASVAYAKPWRRCGHRCKAEP